MYLVLSNILNCITIAQISNVVMNDIAFPFQLHVEMAAGIPGIQKKQRRTNMNKWRWLVGAITRVSVD